MSAESEEHRVAVHEAGHALAAIHLSLQFDEIWIGPDSAASGEIVGSVEIRVPGPDDVPRGTPDEVIGQWQQCRAAGAAAERICFGECLPSRARDDRSRHEKYEECRTARRDEGWKQDVDACLGFLDRQSIETIANALQSQPLFNGRKLLTDHGVYVLLKLKYPPC